MKITKILSNLILLTIFGLGIISCADKATPLSENNIIPKPLSVTEAGGSFTLTNETKLVALGNASEINPVIEIFQSLIKPSTGFDLQTAESGESNVIVFEIESASKKSPGEYTISIDENSIKIAASNGEGLFNGVQTLRQLMPAGIESSSKLGGKIKIGAGKIEDKPEYAYRGFMLDVARHFFSVEDVKHVIDLIAKYKINYLHLHLSDDQGWRIEIKKYPKLTEIGSKRNGSIIGRYPGKGSDNIPEEGFYTQEEVKDIVKYASDRFITVIPEIEMPGHSSAAIAAYPMLSCFPEEKSELSDSMISEKSKQELASGRTKIVQETWGVFTDVYAPTEYTFKFLEDVLDEVMALFPSKYIHVGGDESPKDAWKRSEFCQQLIKEKGGFYSKKL